jgi:hypothetical protein
MRATAVNNGYSVLRTASLKRSSSNKSITASTELSVSVKTIADATESLIKKKLILFILKITIDYLPSKTAFTFSSLYQINQITL